MTPRQQFRRFRKRFKVTQQQLAIALGISRRAVIYIETGRNKPGYKTWGKFKDVVNNAYVNKIADEIFALRGPRKHHVRKTASLSCSPSE